MPQFTRRSLLDGLGSGAILAGDALPALAQQQDRVQRGDAKTFPSMIPGIAQIRVREVTYQPGGKTSAPTGTVPTIVSCRVFSGKHHSLAEAPHSRTCCARTPPLWRGTSGA
jgi:hypothetical protein